MKAEIILRDAEKRVLLHGLVRKRAELATEFQAHEAALRSLSKQMTKLDETIRLFDPNVRVDLIKPKAVSAPFVASHGTTMTNRKRPDNRFTGKRRPRQ